MSASRLQRPTTVCFSVPSLQGNSRSNLQKVAKEVFKTFKPDDVLCLQPRGNGTFLLTLADQDLVIKAQDSGLAINGLSVDVSPVAGGVTYITLTDCPYEVNHETIRYVLSFYGEVKSVSYVTLGPEFAFLKTGDRRVAIVMKKPVPNIVHIAGFDVYAWYRAVQKLCRKCGSTDHLAAACAAAAPGARRCANCGNRWHSTEECAGCFTCKTTAHDPETCPVKKEPLEEAPPSPEKESTPPLKPACDPEKAKPAVAAVHRGLPAQVPVPSAQQLKKAVQKPAEGPKRSPPQEPKPKKKKAGPAEGIDALPEAFLALFGGSPPPLSHPFYEDFKRLKETTANCTDNALLCETHKKDCFKIFEDRYYELLRSHFGFA